METQDSPLAIRSGYVPGMIGSVTKLHGTYYSVYWKLGLFFESKVAKELATFFDQFDPERDGIWSAILGGEIVGAIAIVGDRGDPRWCRLRWFIVSPEHQGKGIGNRLMSEAMAFCQRRGVEFVYLTTFEGLDAARHLYEKWGFRLDEEKEEETWGLRLREQRFLWVRGESS